MSKLGTDRFTFIETKKWICLFSDRIMEDGPNQGCYPSNESPTEKEIQNENTQSVPLMNPYQNGQKIKDGKKQPRKDHC